MQNTKLQLCILKESWKLSEALYFIAEDKVITLSLRKAFGDFQQHYISMKNARSLPCTLKKIYKLSKSLDVDTKHKAIASLSEDHLQILLQSTWQ